MRGRIFSLALAFFATLFVGTTAASAAENSPTFPSCSAPSGTVLASYSNGTHGIPGDTTTYSGSDNVYAVDGNRVLQCFCGGSNGIQTNWWKVGDISQSDISYWQSLGWNFIPDGSAWGLDATGYLAYNANYICSNNNPTSGGAVAGDGLSDGRSDGQSSCPECTQSPHTQTVLPTFTNIFSDPADILGATDTHTPAISLTKSICAACFWWPVLLGEVIALVLFFFLLKKKYVKVNKYLMGAIIGLTAYLIFLLLNKGHVCPDASITFWNWSIPCRYFWALDLVIVLLFSYLIKEKPAISKTSPKKSK